MFVDCRVLKSGAGSKAKVKIDEHQYLWLVSQECAKIPSYTGINRDNLLVSYHWGLNSSLSLLDTIWHRGIGTETWHIILQKCSVFTVGCTRMY